MTTLRFEEVKVTGRRYWKENGRKRQETKVFFQTLNPFNKNTEGFPKSRQQIMAELTAERAAWMAEPKETK